MSENTKQIWTVTQHHQDEGTLPWIDLFETQETALAAIVTNQEDTYKTPVELELQADFRDSETGLGTLMYEDSIGDDAWFITRHI